MPVPTIVALAVLAAFMCLFFLMGAGIIYVLRRMAEDHRLANEYRKLVAMANTQAQSSKPAAAPRGGWIITYTDGRKTLTKHVAGREEKHAMGEFCRSTKYDNIVSVTKG